jgi:Flp pilus assembly protein TadC
MIFGLIVLILTILFNGIFIFLLLTSGEYKNFIEPIDEKNFPLKSIYGVGFKLIELFKIDFKSNRANLLRQEAIILYGEKYGDYYLRVLYAQKFSMCFLVVVSSFFFACFSDPSSMSMMLGLGFLLAGTLYYYYSTEGSKKIKKRSMQFMSEFPGVVSTVALLVASGMMLREAWEEVAYSGDGDLYKQMQKVTEETNNGTSESEALYAFANRCATPVIKKFTSFVVQGLEKGNKDLAHTLKNQSNEMWEVKRQNALQQGELAASKLLIPIVIMFVGILIMVLGPIMGNMGI